MVGSVERDGGPLEYIKVGRFPLSGSVSFSSTPSSRSRCLPSSAVGTPEVSMAVNLQDHDCGGDTLRKFLGVFA